MSSGCPICTEPYSAARQVKVTPCGHSLCAHCVLRLSQRHNDCPFCKANIPKKTWQNLPSNYAMMEIPSGEDALKALALSTASHLISNLQLEAKQLESSLSDLRRAESETKKRRKDLAEKPFPSFSPVVHLQAIREFIGQIEAETEAIVKKADIDQLQPTEVQQLLANYQVIHDRLTVLSERLLSEPEQPSRDLRTGDPIINRIRTLQDESNAKQRRLQGYYACIAEVDTLAQRLSAAKESAVQLFTSEHITYGETGEQLAKAVQSAVVANLQAEKYIEQLQLDIAGIEATRQSLDLEKTELEHCIEIEATERLLAINAELREMDELTKGVVAGWKAQGGSLEGSLKEYIRFVTEETATNLCEAEKTESRCASIRERLAKETQISLFDGDIAALLDRSVQLNQTISEQAAIVTHLKGAKTAEESSIKAAFATVTNLEAAIKRSESDGKSAAARTASALTSQRSLNPSVESTTLRVSNLRLDSSALLEQIHAVQGQHLRADALLETAEKYVAEVLLPAQARIDSELSAFEGKSEATSLRLEDDVAHLQLIYSRVIARMIEKTDLLSPKSPQLAQKHSPKSTENQHIVVRLRADRDKVVKACEEVREKLLGKSVLKMRLGVMEVPKAGTNYGVLWGMAGYFVFLWVASVVGKLV